MVVNKDDFTNKNYLESLVWLRAIAAFFVVVSHSIRTTEVPYAANDEGSYFLPLKLLDLGSFGVYLFFALSGCTLYLSSRDKIVSFDDFWFFYVKRFMRIWPAFALSLFIYIGFIEIFRYLYKADESLWIAQFLNEYSIINIFQYLSLTFNFTGPGDLFIGPYWSLPVEFQYYLLLPFALVLMKGKAGKLIVPVFFGGVLYYIYQETIFEADRYEVFKMGFTFFGGVLLASLYQDITFRISITKSLALFAVIFFIVGVVRIGGMILIDNEPLIQDKEIFFGVVALISVALALITKPVNRRNRFISVINKYGEVSYSIYLFHMLFVGIAALMVVNFEIYGGYPKLFFVFSFSLIGSYIFSIYSYKYIEKPCIEWGRQYSKKISGVISETI